MGLHCRWLASVRELVLQLLVLLGGLVEEEDRGWLQLLGERCSSREGLLRSADRLLWEVLALD